MFLSSVVFYLELVVQLAVYQREIHTLTDVYQAVLVLKLRAYRADKVILVLSLRDLKINIKDDILKDQFHWLFLIRCTLDLEPQIRSGDLDPCML